MVRSGEKRISGLGTGELRTKEVRTNLLEDGNWLNELYYEG